MNQIFTCAHEVKVKKQLVHKRFENEINAGLFTPHLLGYCFRPWCLDGRADGLLEKVCPGCISETERCRKLILLRDIG